MTKSKTTTLPYAGDRFGSGGPSAKTLSKRRKRADRRRQLKAAKTARNAKRGFYMSDEWRALRAIALKVLGRTCLKCGRRPQPIDTHVDHVKPRSRFPHLSLDLCNLQTLCAGCNQLKCATVADYRSEQQREALMAASRGDKLPARSPVKSLHRLRRDQSRIMANAMSESAEMQILYSARRAIG